VNKTVRTVIIMEFLLALAVGLLFAAAIAIVVTFWVGAIVVYLINPLADALRSTESATTTTTAPQYEDSELVVA
jgi:hypothetical protein